MSQLNAIGLVPNLTHEDLLGLSEEQRILIGREYSREASITPELQPDITPEQVRTIMEALNVVPVWGRDGLVVYRFALEGKVLVFGLSPDPETDYVPANILEREWIPNASIPEFIQNMVDWVRGQMLVDPTTPLLVPEDHPEEGCIGFLAPDHNKVWLIAAEQVGKDLSDGITGGWAQVPHLIQSNQGRLELAARISHNTLMTEEQFKASFESMAQRTPQPNAITRKEQQAIVIDLLSGQLSERFKTRYLKKGDQ